MKREQILQKTISEQGQEYATTELVRKPCKKHQGLVKLAWSEKSSWIHNRVNATSDRSGTQTKPNTFQSNEDRKDGIRMKSIFQSNDAVKLIVSKTWGLRRSFSESFKLRTVVKTFRDGEGTTSEEILDDKRSFSDILRPEEFIYRAHAPYTRRKAICDEIEKCIVLNGGTLRSLRRDLIVAVNLTNWHLL